GAFGIRLLQLGAPAVVLWGGGSVGYDTHAGEVTGGQYGSLGINTLRVTRLLSALAFALKNTADPAQAGATLWDSTVVFAVSEFGRSPNGPDGYGANNTIGGNSDHDGWSAWPVFGGPVTKSGAGGRLHKDSINGGFFEQNRFFTSVIRGMGVEE